MHTLASVYEQARLVMNGGITAQIRVQEFLGRATQIISRALPEEHFGGPAGGFIQDATEALKLFKQLDPSEQRPIWTQFYVMRDKVHERFRAAPSATAARTTTCCAPTTRSRAEVSACSNRA